MAGSTLEIQFIRKKEVAQLVGMSVSTIDRLEKVGKFPKRIQLTTRIFVYRKSQIIQWAEKLGEANG